MRDFKELLKTPHIGRIIATQMAARFPAGMYSLGLLMHVEQQFGNYSSAGLVLAAFSISMAVAGPIVSRQLTRLGAMQVLLSTLLVSVTCFATLALTHLPLPGVIALAAIGGATVPPVIPVVRTLYPQLAPGRLINALFNLDAALQEIIWVIGPVLITALVGLTGTANALLAVVGIQFLGGLTFAIEKQVRGLVIPASQHRFGRILGNRNVALMAATSALLIGALGAVEAATVGIFGKGSINVGLVLAICSIGSLLGGLLAGNRKLTSWSIPFRMLLVATGLGLALVLPGFIGLSAALFITGLGTAPTLAAVSTTIAATVEPSDTAEAYGWIGTGQLLGAAAGAAYAGVAIDTFGGLGGVAASLSFALLGVVIASLFRVRADAH